MILIYSGLPGSGKTTRAHEWVAESPDTRRRLNYDDIRLAMFGPTWKFNREDESRMKAEARDLAKAWIESGYDVCIDNTNLTNAVRASWRSLAETLNVAWEEEEICCPVHVCIERDGLRDESKRVGRAVIERMALFTGWIDWADPEFYGNTDKSPRRFIIVDMDGTLADCSRRRPALDEKPKNYDKFYADVDKDPVIQPIVDLVDMLALWYNVIVVSGRPIDHCGKQTEAWLAEHLTCEVKHLFMRNGGDFRPDFVVKQEILDLLPKDQIAYVIDDRDQVVEMWRKNGLTCLQVAKGDF